MSARSCCYDNACAESFFHTLKVECIHGEDFASREIMRTAVFNYIECDYNRWRRHSACGGLSPEHFENQNLAQGRVHITRVGSHFPFKGKYILNRDDILNGIYPSDLLHGIDYLSKVKSKIFDDGYRSF